MADLPPNHHDDKVDSELSLSPEVADLRRRVTAACEVPLEHKTAWVHQMVKLETTETELHVETRLQGGRCKATWLKEFRLLWRKAGPPNHHDAKVDSEQ